MLRYLILTLFLSSFHSGKGQSIVESGTILHISPQYQHNILTLADTSFCAPLEGVTLTTLKFYISALSLYSQGNIVWSEEESFHLVDAEDTTSYHWQLNTPEDLIFDEVSFLLGIDSTTSVSGALGGDLDPTKGMYWAWNSGYINFKIEGTSDQSILPDHSFQFHLGGYAHPNYNAQEVNLTVLTSNEITIALDVFKFYRSN